MATPETLADRDYVYVTEAGLNGQSVIKCFIVMNEKRATNPIGIITETSADVHQVKIKVTGSESVVDSGLSLANAKTLLINTLVTEGALTSGASDLTE